MKVVVAFLILTVLTYRLIFPWASPLLDFVGIFSSMGTGVDFASDETGEVFGTGRKGYA